MVMDVDDLTAIYTPPGRTPLLYVITDDLDFADAVLERLLGVHDSSLVKIMLRKQDAFGHADRFEGRTVLALYSPGRYNNPAAHDRLWLLEDALRKHGATIWTYRT